MFCSNCREEMSAIAADGQKILHCKNCGSSFFEENGINRISTGTAEKLAFEKQGNFILDGEKPCPRDSTKLQLLKNLESVPSNVELFNCPVCRGVFTYPDSLLIFKKAQGAKIKYFKLWNMPLPSVRSVLIIVFVGIIAVSGYFNFQRSLAPLQAEDVVRNVNVSRSGRYVFLSFRTDSPYSSRIIFDNRTSQQKTEKVISLSPTRLHYFTTTDFTIGDEIFFQIILKDTRDNEIVTKEQKLEAN